MARFVFRPQILLDRKTEAKQRAEEVLLARESELAQERGTMQELENDLLRMKTLYQSRRERRATGGAEGGAWLIVQSNYLRGLLLDMQQGQTSVLSQQVFLDRAREAVESAKEGLAAIRREVEQLEKYKARAQKKFLAEQAYREELELDEIGTGIYLSRRQKR